LIFVDKLSKQGENMTDQVTKKLLDRDELRQAVRWIARLGGFLGRKSDGEPGITVIWRGWQRLQDIADTWYLIEDQTTYG
jgi:hypothetical protein